MKLFIALTPEDIESIKNGDVVERSMPTGSIYDNIELNILTEDRLKTIKEANMFASFVGRS